MSFFESTLLNLSKPLRNWTFQRFARAAHKKGRKKDADDTKIYRPMTSHEDTTILQNDLDCLQSWSAKWLLNFNLHKCKVMSITKSTACNHDSADYYLKNQSSTPILRCTEEIDLGVVFDTKLSFRKHINMSINKANRLLGIIR